MSPGFKPSQAPCSTCPAKSWKPNLTKIGGWVCDPSLFYTRSLHDHHRPGRPTECPDGEKTSGAAASSSTQRLLRTHIGKLRRL